MAKKYYSVRRGRTPGIYQTWQECKSQVMGYKGAIFKKFSNLEDAQAFLEAGGGAPSQQKSKKDQDPDQEDQEPDLAPGQVAAYVDGSFNKKKKVFGYGIVLFTEDGKEELSGSAGGNYAGQRNVAGEVLAAAKAIEEARNRGAKKITIYHDYQGIAAWPKGDWKANNPLTQKYRDYVQTLQDEMEVDFRKVEAHTGVQFNEEADRLAKKACGLGKKKGKKDKEKDKKKDSPS